MAAEENAPKDAAAVILFKDDKIFLAQRNPQISFLGGWHAFPGGKLDAEDARIEVRNCADKDMQKFIVAAARETFEEIGVLLVRGGDRITKGQRASLHDDLTSGRFSFAEILENWGLQIDAKDFQDAGFWITPKFSRARFKTRFFIAGCPRKQEPQVFGEFTIGEFIAPGDALQIWEKGEILISPPVLISLREAAKNDSESLQNRLLEKSQNCDGEILHIKLNPFITVFPLRAETLPPATHTNCFIVGEREFVVIDAASPFADEQKNLHEFIDSLIEKGNSIKCLIITHLHRDHFSGVNDLRKRLAEKFNLNVPIAAHSLTAESLKDKIRVENFIEDNQVTKLKTSGETFRLRALHTPGHARGHLCFYDERRGFLLSGDNVISTGSVLIAPPEGNMKDYLKSLKRLEELPNLRFLCGSHGAAVYNAQGKIESYIAHRLEREEKISAAISAGAKTAREIVEKVYTDISPALCGLAEKSVEAHLEKLKDENKLPENARQTF